MELPSDPRRRNALVLALGRAMEAIFDESDWKELGYATDTIDYIRLSKKLISSRFGGCVSRPSGVVSPAIFLNYFPVLSV